MNVRISPPQKPTTDPNVALECEQAIDGAVRELVDHAIVAGWPPEAAFEAIKRATERQASPITKIPIPQMTRSKLPAEPASRWRPSNGRRGRPQALRTA